MMVDLNENIIVYQEPIHNHSKASERYIHVKFVYPDYKRDGRVPIEYRRTGLNIETDDEMINHLNYVYDQMKKENINKRIQNEELYWNTEKSKAGITKPFFDTLKLGGRKCIDCDLPKNPNWARRIQDLKEMGYTIATDTKRYCNKCKKNKTHLILLPIKRGDKEGNGYESWSPQLRKRILELLNYFDVYEYTVNKNCLPDHKFSEIRRGEDTKGENPDDMTDQEIIQKFQLLTNQRNQQKREMCRQCYQTGKRGTIYGIPFFYEGDENWDKSIPKTGKDSEKGCVGCPRYDIQTRREKLIEKLKKGDK